MSDDMKAWGMRRAAGGQNRNHFGALATSLRTFGLPDYASRSVEPARAARRTPLAAHHPTDGAQ